MAVELRVAKVLTAERVPKSKKLMQAARWTPAPSERTIVAGIAEAYEPEALVGRTIVIVANLKPAKLMGIESNGMVLAASARGGKPVLVEPGPGRRRQACGCASIRHSSFVIRHSAMIDSHCHLADEVFEADLEAVIGARPGGGLDGRDVHPRGRRRPGSARGPSACAASGSASRFAVGVHPHQAHECAGQPGRADAAAARRPGGAAGDVRASARSASTTTTTSRRATCSTTSSPSSSPRRGRSTLPVVIHTREADDDTFAMLAQRGPRRCPACSIASRAASRGPGARSTWASTCRWPAS